MNKCAAMLIMTRVWTRRMTRMDMPRATRLLVSITSEKS
jgi:hypothetical protein